MAVDTKPIDIAGHRQVEASQDNVPSDSRIEPNCASPYRCKDPGDKRVRNSLAPSIAKKAEEPISRKRSQPAKRYFSHIFLYTVYIRWSGSSSTKMKKRLRKRSIDDITNGAEENFEMTVKKRMRIITAEEYLHVAYVR